MKLLAKTNLYISATTIVLMLIGMIIVYVLVLNKLSNEGDEHLLLDKNKIILLLKQGKPLMYFSSNVGENINIREVPIQTIFDNRFKDYKMEEEEGDEGEDEFTFRQLLFQTTVGTRHYEVEISPSLAERREIVAYIAIAILLFLAFSLFILFVLNRYISRFIWSPFYDTISQLRNWTLLSNKKIVPKETNIDEFIELNQTSNMFIQKIQADYINLKEFTENISHETQTPVAIISAKLEMLIQEDDYSHKQQRLLADAYMATLRLKKLNQALISLTRIEKGLYAKIEKVNITGMIERKLMELSEFIQAKNIRIEKELEVVEKEINAEIFNLLINNLLINSIKHNRESDGMIRITLRQNELLIENTGSDSRIGKESIFERFKPYTTDSESVGLGLSIIKKITDFLEWEASYEFKDGLHDFRIELKKR